MRSELLCSVEGEGLRPIAARKRPRSTEGNLPETARDNGRTLGNVDSIGDQHIRRYI